MVHSRPHQYKLQYESGPATGGRSAPLGHGGFEVGPHTLSDAAAVSCSSRYEMPFDMVAVPSAGGRLTLPSLGSVCVDGQTRSARTSDAEPRFEDAAITFNLSCMTEAVGSSTDGVNDFNDQPCLQNVGFQSMLAQQSVIKVEFTKA